MVYIYILKLEDDKYYVGKTTNPTIRVDEHFAHSGSAWTIKHHPMSVIEIIPDCDDYDEDKYTIKTMAKYGIENVRGGSFVRIDLDSSEVNVILKMLNSSENKCFYCNSEGHFIVDCQKRKDKFKISEILCHRCDRKGHKSLSCRAQSKADHGPILDNCYRCGKDGHWRITCKETTDKNGKKLDNSDDLCIIM